MKMLVFLILLFIANPVLSLETCPNFQSEYIISKCPTKRESYQTIRILQPDCRAVGFQRLAYSADGAILSYGSVIWEPVGAGKLLDREDQTNAYLKESFFDQDSLYTYNYQVDKSTNEITLVRSEIIDLLREGNIFVSNETMGAGHTWYNLKNCK